MFNPLLGFLPAMTLNVFTAEIKTVQVISCLNYLFKFPIFLESIQVSKLHTELGVQGGPAGLCSCSPWSLSLLGSVHGIQ